MNRNLAALVVAISLSVGALGFFGVALMRETKSAEKQDFPTLSSSELEAAQHLPIYPNARELGTSKVWPTQWNGASYVAYAAGWEVLNFYKEQLSHKGWKLQWENSQMQNDTLTSYAWLDEHGNAPYDLTLGLEATNGPPSHVRLSLYRVPNLSKVPLYPHATNVSDSAGETPVPYLKKVPTNKRIILYTAMGTQDDVLAYYRDTLPQYGWTLDSPDSGSQISAGSSDAKAGQLLVSWSTGGVDSGMWSASISVDVTSAPGGQASVKLVIRGETNLR